MKRGERRVVRSERLCKHIMYIYMCVCVCVYIYTHTDLDEKRGEKSSKKRKVL
jgi:hypothetical protein